VVEEFRARRSILGKFAEPVRSAAAAALLIRKLVGDAEGLCSTMDWSFFLWVIWAVFGLAGWATAFIWLGRARRYREAFERAFDVARRAYSFSDTEKAEFVRIIGEQADFARILGESIEKDPKVS
jgi:hypothetical protein